MADTFASFGAKVVKFQKELTDESLMHTIGKMAKDEARTAASSDLGGDPKFSGWAPELVTRYDLIGEGKLSFKPSRRSAGPWTVAESGRNQAAGPAIGAKGKRGSRKRWNGRTQGKNTATDALAAIEPKVPKLADTHIGRAIRKTF